MRNLPYWFLGCGEVKLKKENYAVVCADSGEAAIRAAKTRKFDLAILDIMMPDLSGWDVFNKIKKLNPKQKVMFLSVLQISPERRAQLEQYEAVDYLLKPFDRSVLVKRVRSMLDLGDNVHRIQNTGKDAKKH